MNTLLKKYVSKLSSQGLADEGHVILMALDDDIYSLRGASADPGSIISSKLERVFDKMNINSLLYAIPSEPYRSILEGLLDREDVASEPDVIMPQDCETRTFLHDIPVINEARSSLISNALSSRKAAIIRQGPAIVSYGSVSPEQAFISYSSVCFSTYVKYFFDTLNYLKSCSDTSMKPSEHILEQLRTIRSKDRKKYASIHDNSGLITGQPADYKSERTMMIEAGRRLVTDGLVDSFFGNISSLTNGRIMISETSSSLDELEEAIDEVPFDGSSSVGITASSETSTHKRIYEKTGYDKILHGHPRFSVVMSMYCTERCDHRGECYKDCPEERYMSGVPIVPGEVGTGPTGIESTVPDAFKKSDAVVVYGHGVFCAGSSDFNGTMRRMTDIEEQSRTEYDRVLDELLEKCAAA
ncbi:MAG: class II aldolase/adducin family protein [Nitrospirota bacterium]|nr:MAG: class II aldolase/adducin family protein [Nitrospirota bacterium]